MRWGCSSRRALYFRSGSMAMAPCRFLPQLVRWSGKRVGEARLEWRSPTRARALGRACFGSLSGDSDAARTLLGAAPCQRSRSAAPSVDRSRTRRRAPPGRRRSRAQSAKSSAARSWARCSARSPSGRSSPLRSRAPSASLAGGDGVDARHGARARHPGRARRGIAEIAELVLTGSAAGETRGALVVAEATDRRRRGTRGRPRAREVPPRLVVAGRASCTAAVRFAPPC